MQDSLDAPATVFFDPNKLSEDGTVALKSQSNCRTCYRSQTYRQQRWNDTKFALLTSNLFHLLLHLVGRLSEECEFFAYGLSSSGSDWVTVHFMKADDLSPLPDVLERVKFSCLAWTHDAKGIFYNCYPRQEGKTDGQEELLCK